MGLITENPERYPESLNMVALMAIDQMYAARDLQKWALVGINKYRCSREFKKAMNKIKKESGVFWVITSNPYNQEHNKQTGSSYSTFGGVYPSQKDAAYCLQILIMSGIMNPDSAFVCKQTDEVRLIKERFKKGLRRQEIQEQIKKGELTFQDVLNEELANLEELGE